MRRTAFTLIELVVVIAIVAALAALSVPLFGRVTQSGRATACMSNLRQLGGALQLYLNDHNMVMPTLGAARADKTTDGAFIDNTLNAYATNPKVFACPADTKGDAANTGTSYYWNSLLNGQPPVVCICSGCRARRVSFPCSVTRTRSILTRKARSTCFTPTGMRRAN